MRTIVGEHKYCNSPHLNQKHPQMSRLHLALQVHMELLIYKQEQHTKPYHTEEDRNISHTISHSTLFRYFRFYSIKSQ